ncbi:alpha/beta hydrolase [Sphingomonas bacterium]|uniref:alpha/beta hydrolase n=1 Tax=Sphingomonas bacterium TaxID=1895847 RepID=UPI001576395B|nr:alpha/beta hydrolase [Sphingomonas bacterium]
MEINRRVLLGAAAGAVAASTVPAASAAQPGAKWPPAEQIRLWPRRPPNAPARLPTPGLTLNGPASQRELWLTGVAEPVIGVFRPPNPDGRALLSIPGGGYEFLSIENEGLNVASTFTPLGVTVFVLAYRLPGEGWSEPQDVPLQDGQRAMRLIRANGARLGIDPARLGVIGFSAGGLLAASLATAWHDPVYARIDAADEMDARPAFAGLAYPVVSGDLMRVGTGPAGRFDTRRRLGEHTPPLFIVHALDDPVVPFSEPMGMLAAAREARVPVEAHFLQQGGHGFGPRYLSPDLPGSHWPVLFDLWMSRSLAAPGPVSS